MASRWRTADLDVVLAGTICQTATREKGERVHVFSSAPQGSATVQVWRSLELFTCSCECACMHECMWVCVCVCACVCACMCIYEQIFYNLQNILFVALYNPFHLMENKNILVLYIGCSLFCVKFAYFGVISIIVIFWQNWHKICNFRPIYIQFWKKQARSIWKKIYILNFWFLLEKYWFSALKVIISLNELINYPANQHNYSSMCRVIKNLIADLERKFCLVFKNVQFYRCIFKNILFTKQNVTKN